MAREDCTRKVVFHIDDIAFFKRMYPEVVICGPAFRATYTLSGNALNAEYYDLECEDGRTNVNDLNGYEKSILRECDAYYENRVQLVGSPDYCTAVESVG